MLAITGMQYNDIIGTFSQQDVELDKLFMDVACYNKHAMSAPRTGRSTRRRRFAQQGQACGDAGRQRRAACDR